MAELTEQARTRIYVSYQARRDDRATSRLLDDLRRRFGPETIVTSSDFSDIPPQHLAEQIERALDSCHALVVIIGQEWLGTGSARGVGEFDVPLFEVATGLLKEQVTTIPVLVEEGRMPLVSDLPKPLAGLADRHGHVVTSADWDRDVGELFKVLARTPYISQLLRRARRASEALDFEDALQLLDSARHLDPERVEVTRLAEIVRAMRQEHARQVAEEERRRVDERLARYICGRARAALELGDYATAQTALEGWPAGLGPELEALRRELDEALARHLEDRRRLDRERQPPAEPRPQGRGGVLDENVQFTVFRRTCIQPERWYPLLAFAHLSERRADAPPDEPDPVAEVQAQAARVLGTELAAFRPVTQDSGHAVMREGELRFVPQMDGVEFNPRERRFLWTEAVHREDFRMRAGRSMDGQVARGTLTVYSGNLVLADVQLMIKVDRRTADAPSEAAHARAYRRIFASYSHRDTAIVEEFESHATAIGDTYLRDVVSLRSGEVWNERLVDLINQADVFQLFWSWNALASPMVRAEWQHALALNRPCFVRPVYWEDPLPEKQGLPPPELQRLHFQKVYPRKASEESSAPPAPPTAAVSTPAPAARPAPAPKPSAPASGEAPSASAAPSDTGVSWTPEPRAQRGAPMPRVEARAPSPRRSNLRLVRYTALAAVCVITASVYVAVRPFLMSSSSPPITSEVEAPPAAPPPPPGPAQPSPPASGTGKPSGPPGSSGPPPGSSQPPILTPVPLPPAEPSVVVAVPQPTPAAPAPRPPERERPETRPVPEPVPQPTGPNDLAETRRDIEGVIREYEQGWRAMDLAALMRVWLMPPRTVDQITAEFRRAQAIDVRVRILDVQPVSDTRATVTVDEFRRVTPRNSNIVRRAQQRKVFHFAKRGPQWIIVAIGG